jgi:hypothetical protein
LGKKKEYARKAVITKMRLARKGWDKKHSTPNMLGVLLVGVDKWEERAREVGGANVATKCTKGKRQDSHSQRVYTIQSSE